MNLKRKFKQYCNGLALFLLKIYKKFFSWMFWGSCRFTPTCSEYTYQAITKYGTIPGLWLGFKRV
ncbi:membrane protein insertion efficiency factor YidD, partial [Candidatus Microgenomates bacterium]|nr:membrane protein insertion efficiency factor YidD [Candidatus Microgenomates bacterium]